MGGSAIGINVLNGFAGTLARTGDEIIKSRAVHTGANAIPFGSPVVLYKDGNGVSDGTVQLFGASNVASDFVGIAVRKVKQSMGVSDENFGKYYDTDICDVIERGSVMVVCSTGTPSSGSPVYIRTALNANNYPDAQIGDIEAEADVGNQVTLTNCKFFGCKDSDNVVELVILERQGV